MSQAIERALISVSDKTGIVDFARALSERGVAILSTSSGLLTDREASKKGVGGEVLAYVW